MPFGAVDLNGQNKDKNEDSLRKNKKKWKFKDKLGKWNSFPPGITPAHTVGDPQASSLINIIIKATSSSSIASLISVTSALKLTPG